jgi:hypothetical protein
LRVFLSYATEDRNLAEQVHLALLGAGHQTFFDKQSLPPGGDYHDTISTAVKQSDALVFLISPDSILPGSYALTELKHARAKWQHPKGFVLPVLVRNVPWPEIPNYLKAVTILESEGNIPAEVVLALADLPEQNRTRQYNAPNDRNNDPKDQQVVFVSEGMTAKPDAIRVAFSVWNNKDRPIKLYKVAPVEHVRVSSELYSGPRFSGPRHELQLNQVTDMPWNRETFEIPPRQSDSFEASYTIIKTGPDDGSPWIVLGITLAFHDSLGERSEIHSDSVILIPHVRTKLDTKLIRITDIEKLNDPDHFRHVIYSTLLQSLSNRLLRNGETVVRLMREDYFRGFSLLSDVVAKKGTQPGLKQLEESRQLLTKLLDREEECPLSEDQLSRKHDILHTLWKMSLHYEAAREHLSIMLQAQRLADPGSRIEARGSSA